VKKTYGAIHRQVRGERERRAFYETTFLKFRKRRGGRVLRISKPSRFPGQIRKEGLEGGRVEREETLREKRGV